VIHTLIAQHVSSDIIAHHQELLNCIFTASGDNYLDCSTCFERYYCSSSGASKLFLQLLVTHTLIAQHVSSDIIAHHQELLNCIFIQLLVLITMVVPHVSSDINAHHQELLNCILQLLVIQAFITLRVSSDITHHQEIINYFYRLW
jgi:hypothetical protein